MTEPILDVNSPAAKERWASIAMEARRRRLAIEVRDGTPDLPYRAAGKERSGADWDGGNFATLDQAFRVAESWVLDHPIPGPVALRDELRNHGRKLAVLTPRDLNRKGGDFAIYRHFRDRILPLAFDNLVDAVRLEALEDAIRELLSAYDRELEGATKTTRRILTVGDLALSVATLRGLVEPKEAGDDAAAES